MAHMGLRLAQRANGVAKLHGVVSREMFAGLYPGFEPEEVPIGSVTNGVHLPTWAAREMYDVAGDMADWQDLASASEWPAARPGQLRAAVGAAADPARPAGDDGPRGGPAVLAAARQLDRRAGLDRVDPRPGHPDHRLRPPGVHLQAADPDAARPRPAQGDPARPATGRCRSSSPARRTRPTSTASGSCRRWSGSPTTPGIRHRIAFLPDYDMGMASVLCAGADVWLNNPIRPQEASGTSGMKAALNGVAQPVHLRRLVGRAVRRAGRLDHPDGGRHRRREPARRPGGLGAVRPDREAGRAAVLPPRRRRSPRRLGRHRPAHPGLPRSAGAGHPDGPRLRQRLLRAGGHGFSRAVTGDLTVAKDFGGLEGHACGRPGRACG